MTVSLIFLGIIMLTIVVWLVRQTTNTTPWIADPAGDAVAEAERIFDTSPKFGLMAFLAVIVSFFALFVSAYAMRMNLSDWSPLSEPRLLIGNTGLLFLSSIAMQIAYMASNKGELKRVRGGLFAGALFAVLFLVGQYLAWQQLMEAGFYLQTNPANAFFYLFTGLHGLHLLGGLWVLSAAIVTVFRGGFDPVEVRQTVQLCTVYWHFLLLVWLGLYWLLLST